jgi:hypothetical protein
MISRPVLRWTMSFCLLSVYTAALIASQSLPAVTQATLTDAAVVHQADAANIRIPWKPQEILRDLIKRMPLLLPILLPHVS